MSQPANAEKLQGDVIEKKIFVNKLLFKIMTLRMNMNARWWRSPSPAIHPNLR